jgi:translation initiation factor 3 subunit J
MADAWDDDGSDAWDMESDDDEAIEAKLGLKTSPGAKASDFDDEEDLAVVEMAREKMQNKAVLKTKGKALAAKRVEEEERKMNEELTRKAIELEMERESKMTPEELRAVERQRELDAAMEGANDLFGGVDDIKKGGAGGKAMGAGDTVKMVDLKDHLKHARKVGQCIRV